MTRSRSLLAIAAVGAVMGLVPATAHADSIVFVRGGNLWIAGVDGSGARAITTDGVVGGDSEYKTVSAAKGSGAPRLGYRQGPEIGTIGADGSGKQALPGDESPSVGSSAEIDPTGRRVAWNRRVFIGSSQYSYWRTKNPDGSEERDSGNGGVDHTTWADDGGRAMTSELHVSGSPYPSEDGCTEDSFNVVVDDGAPTTGNPPSPPRDFTCVAGTNLFDPAASPDFARVAVAANASGGNATDPTRILVLPRAPGMQQGTFLTPEGFGATDPDWSPDGRTIVFEGPDRTVWTVPAGGGPPVKVLDDATEPALTPFGGTAGSGGGGAGSGGGGAGGAGPGGGGSQGDDGPGGTAAAGAPSITGGTSFKLRTVLRGGLALRGQVAAPARLSAKLKLSGKQARRLGLGRRALTVSRDTVQVTQAGSYRLKFRFARKVRRKLARARRVTLGADVSATFADGSKKRTRKTLTLKR